MLDYILFWIAKELAPIAIILGVLVVTVVGVLFAGAASAIYDKFRSRKGR